MLRTLAEGSRALTEAGKLAGTGLDMFAGHAVIEAAAALTSRPTSRTGPNDGHAAAAADEQQCEAGGSRSRLPYKGLLLVREWQGAPTPPLGDEHEQPVSALAGLLGALPSASLLVGTAPWQAGGLDPAELHAHRIYLRQLSDGAADALSGWVLEAASAPVAHVSEEAEVSAG